MVQSVHFSKLLDGSLSRVFPFKVRNSGISCLMVQKKYKTRSQISPHVRSSYKALSGFSLLSSECDVTNSDQCLHFTSQNTQHWALEKGIQ